MRMLPNRGWRCRSSRRTPSATRIAATGQRSAPIGSTMPAIAPSATAAATAHACPRPIGTIARHTAAGTGHRVLVGTPEYMADEMEAWLEAEAADGFNVMGAALPSDLEDFIEQVVPILRARGLFREDYDGTTLRDHYGLRRPANQYATTAAPVTVA